MLSSTEEKKGLALSHLLGFALFSEVALNVFKFSLPLTPINSIPIRLIAIWLLMDRTGRIGRLRFGIWDALITGFVLVSGLGMIYTATTAPAVPLSFEEYRKFVGLFLNPYLYYLVAREGLNRRGFRPDITILWLVAGFAWSALVGLMQTRDLFHARSWSLIYANGELNFLRQISDNANGVSDDNASMASGTAAWWNSMALEMLVAFSLVFGSTFLRRPRWYEWVLGVLFMAAFIATQSRGGLAAFAICAIATFVWFFIHRKFWMATIIGGTVAVGVIIWLLAVFALKLERFTTTIEGEKVKGSVYTQSFTSRLQQQKQLIDIGLRQPIFGTGPNFGYQNMQVWSPYTLSGSADTNYGFTFAQFGLVGLAFLVSIQFYLLAFIRASVAYRPFAFAAFFVGVAFTVHGLVEFLLYGRTFMVMNVLAAYAGSPYLVSEQGRAAFKRVVKAVGPAPIPVATAAEA